ncbi:MAG TPA: SdrD B-like domain-containing protein [Humisphaera sp.]|nr:SdrD B-like domain-containing protein [Humisphaera sp.]
MASRSMGIRQRWRTAITCGTLDTGEPSTLTASDGTFTFKTLTAGTYCIRQILPAGSRATSPTQGYLDVTLSAGQSTTGKIFADTTRALISGVVFKDTNASGTQDGGELGLSGWVVYLDTNNNGKLNAGEASYTTGPDGKFNFVVPAGSYHLREVPKSGFTRTAPKSGVFSISLSDGQSVIGKQFGDR